MKSDDITVRHSGVYHFQNLDTRGQAHLISIEGERTIPFAIKRVYTISAFVDHMRVRGGHAHRATEQVIVCPQGSCILSLDDGEHTQDIVLDDPTIGIRLGPFLWHTMHDFSPECVLMVYADAWYDERDYIRDYDEFRRLIAQQAAV